MTDSLAIAAPRRQQSSGTFGRLIAGRRPKQEVMVSGIILAIAVACALVPNLLAPADPNRIGVGDLLEAPSAVHLMGTDEFGRDILSRIIHSTRIELIVSLAGVGLAVAIGVPLGLLSGYRGGWIDALAMRVQDGLMAFPSILFAILVVVAFGTTALTIVLTVGVVYFPRFARLVRGTVLVLKDQEFVLASRCCGASDVRIVRDHVLPNATTPILVLATLAMGIAILIEAGLSYLGLGIQPPTPTWGTMLQHAQSYPAQAPWYVVAPGVCIFLLVLALNTLGDSLRDTLDPRLRGR
ncbi:MAG TPA: ABC transporter permease [Chloroflexota bacterium]|jgi:peptide/nickel transport system permease protein